MSNTAFLDSLQAYNTCEGNRSRLDMLVTLADAGIDYYWKGYGIPQNLPPAIDGVPRTQLNSLETYEVQFSVPPGSTLTAVSAYSEQAAGFSIQVVDAASGVAIFNTQDIRNLLIGTYEGVTEDVPAGPSFVPAPCFFLDRGLVQVTLKNLAIVPNLVQILLEFAIPNTAANSNRKQVM